MSKKIKFWIVIISFVGNCVTGYFTYLYFTRKPGLKIKIVEKTKIAYKTVYRDYNNLTQKDCIEELSKYDTEKPFLDGYIKNNNLFFAEAGLNGRQWSREFKLKIKQSGNWRYYLGFGAVGMAAGGFIIYKIIK
jgi:hypothetical protein